MEEDTIEYANQIAATIEERRRTMEPAFPLSYIRQLQQDVEEEMTKALKASTQPPLIRWYNSVKETIMAEKNAMIGALVLTLGVIALQIFVVGR